MLKTAFDFLFSSFFLIILSPVFLLLAIWIKLDSKGPILYLQKRVGRNNQDFYLIKFRSMAVNADKQGLLTIGGRDPRITPAGYFIRKYKLDELPQLINVWWGDMSMVGPRPEVRKYVALYTEEQRRVLSVKPGISDFASILYRNETELLSKAADPEAFYIKTVMPDKLRINLAYVDHGGFFTDIKIIAGTLKAILKP